MQLIKKQKQVTFGDTIIGYTHSKFDYDRTAVRKSIIRYKHKCEMRKFKKQMLEMIMEEVSS